MQRQSLGSPVSKLDSHGVVDDDDDDNHKDDAHGYIGDDSERRRKSPKQPSRRFSSSSSAAATSSPLSSSKLIHFIPLLTLICFLVLYLVSHTPSQSDFAQFKRSSKLIDSGAIDRLGDIKRSNVLAISNFRNLQEIADKQRVRPKSRKIANF